MARTTFLSDGILNTYRATTLTAPANVYAGLITAVTDLEAGTVTETTYGAYARQAITFGAPGAASGGRRIQNSGVLTFPAKSDAGSVSIIAVGVWDALTVGNLRDVIYLDDAAALPIAVAVVDTGDITSNLIVSPAHGLVADQQVRLEAWPAGPTLPAGLSENTTYWVIATGLTADRFSLSATQGGAAIDITAQGRAILMTIDPKTVAQNDQPTFAANTLSLLDD